MTAVRPIDELTVAGRVVRPGDDDYDAARTPWNHFVARRPAAVVYAASTQDVVDAVAWARRSGREIRVRSGGHSLEGYSSVDDGVVIDVSGLKSATVTDPDDGSSATARLGAGLTQSEAVTALGRHGLAVPTGNEGSVGLIGATLGGGFGPLTRPFGMACDHLLGAEIVVAEEDLGARTIWVDADAHADLLWALRGGGNGGFGIVTAMLARVQQAYAGLQVPIDDEPANWKFTSQFVREPYPPAAVELIARFLATAPTPQCNWFAQAFGGVVPSSEPAGGSAFAHRDALFYAEPGAGWGDRSDPAAAQDPLTPACLAWIADFAGALAPYGDGAYVNVPNADEPDWARAYWRDNVDRLRAVKAAHDPHDVFHHQQSIASTG